MLAFGAVLLSAVCSGTATILQAGVARRLPTVDRLDAGLLIRLLRRSAYLGALALLVVGLLLATFSLRTLPLYLVQAGPVVQPRGDGACCRSSSSSSGCSGRSSPRCWPSASGSSLSR